MIEHVRHKEKADLVILMSHMGLPLDVKLASIVNGIDIILSGHSHDRIDRPILQDDTLIIQSGSSSSFIGRIDLEWDGLSITDLKHRLIPLFEDEYPADPVVADMITEILTPYEDMLKEKVGRLLTPLHRMTLNEAPMDQLITDAYLKVTGADVAFSHGWRYGVPVLPGIVTMKDLYNIIPTNPELFTIDMLGDALLEALESNLEQVFAPDPFHQKGGYLLRSSNLSMAFKPYNPMYHRIQHIEINGQPLQSNKTYTVAGGGEQILKKHQAGRRMWGISAHDALKALFHAQPDGVKLSSDTYIHMI